MESVGRYNDSFFGTICGFHKPRIEAIAVIITKYTWWLLHISVTEINSFTLYKMFLIYYHESGSDEHSFNFYKTFLHGHWLYFLYENVEVKHAFIAAMNL